MLYNNFDRIFYPHRDCSKKYHQYAKIEGIEGVKSNHLTEDTIESSYRKEKYGKRTHGVK